MEIWQRHSCCLPGKNQPNDDSFFARFNSSALAGHLNPLSLHVDATTVSTAKKYRG